MSFWHPNIRKEEPLRSFSFPTKPETQHVDESGSEVRFALPGAHNQRLLASFLNHKLLGDPRLGKYEVIISSNRENMVTILGPGGMPTFQLKADMAALAAQFSCITQEELQKFREAWEQSVREASASLNEGMVTYATGMKP